jgi:hypothetical protein
VRPKNEEKRAFVVVYRDAEAAERFRDGVAQALVPRPPFSVRLRLKRAKGGGARSVQLKRRPPGANSSSVAHVPATFGSGPSCPRSWRASGPAGAVEKRSIIMKAIVLEFST